MGWWEQGWVLTYGALAGGPMPPEARGQGTAKHAPCGLGTGDRPSILPAARGQATAECSRFTSRLRKSDTQAELTWGQSGRSPPAPGHRAPRQFSRSHLSNVGQTPSHPGPRPGP